MLLQIYITFLVISIALLIISAFIGNSSFVIFSVSLAMGLSALMLPASIQGVQVVSGETAVTNSTTNTTTTTYQYSTVGGNSWLFLFNLGILIISVGIIMTAAMR